MARFPFGIYFRVEQIDIVVVAVMHGSRHPLRWQDRP
jgi:plasmid stabilization system protein ParE